MPTAVSYPGVYIEEVPSGVRTIVGVDTSVAAFVGYTRRGPNNHPVQIFSFADFERRFGGLDAESPVSYAVQHFFLNGGAKAWVARVASGAAAASVDLRNGTGGGDPVVLTVAAASEGDWGNHLVVTVDYDTANPGSLFNLTVEELSDQNGTLVVARSEVHRNLSMNSFSGNYCVSAVNADSNLVVLERPALTFTNAGAAASGFVAQADVDALLASGANRLSVSIDGGPVHEFSMDLSAVAGAGGLEDQLDAIAAAIQASVDAIEPAETAFDLTPTVTMNSGGTAGVMVFTGGSTGERASVSFSNAASSNAASFLKLGLSNGGRESSGAAQHRPAASGTLGARFPEGIDLSADASGSVTVNVNDATGTSVHSSTVSLWSSAPGPATLSAARTLLQQALSSQANPVLAQSVVHLVDDRLVVRAGGQTMSHRLAFSAGVSSDLGLDSGVVNIKAYALGVGPSVAAQDNAVPGDNGAPPNAVELGGSRAQKTGIFALENTDLFNILLLPDQSDPALLSAAIAYAEERRSMVLLDLPASIDTLDEARTWLQSHGTLRHKNAAAYFPRIRMADALQNNRVRSFPNSGAMAGLYARTDAARGVWKAPAGTEASLRGVFGLDYPLTDPENGVLNPLGLNCLRQFPAFGPVSWGARTLVGSDQAASEWKYVPVRRLALFIEESLYRGTQWVVFEPNDEPLWSQIRLNVGAFMNNLFRQGAFQGKTPREAYLVQCDSTTTTQDDINRGIVNILVGFAPLKPAEFVIIRLQQLAGQLQA